MRPRPTTGGVNGCDISPLALTNRHAACGSVSLISPGLNRRDA